jgi:hypothetical protein
MKKQQLIYILLVNEYETKNGITALSRPSYSADKVSADFCVFILKKIHLQGKQVPVI